MQLSILTPEGQIFQGETNYLKVPGTLGPMEILRNHAPIVTSLTKGKLVFTSGNRRETWMVTGGFLEFNNNRGTLLADAAEKVE